MSLKGTLTASDYLPFDDYRRLVQTLIDEKKYWWATYCIVSFCTGLRFSDVKRLTWGDIIEQRNLLITEQKTGKVRSIPIGKNASDTLTRLYEKQEHPALDTYILSTQTGRAGETVTIQYVNQTVKKWIKKYNLNIENFSTHTFRKTFGRYVYEKSGRTNESILYLNRIFKHASVNTTMVYLGIRDDEIAGIFNSIEVI